MSATEIFRREVDVHLREDGDGRTLVSKLVPYGEVATVSDDGITSYQEQFLRGAFDAQTRAAHRIRVFLNYQHGQSLQDQVGHAVSIEERADGLYGELRVLNHSDGDKALEMIRAGVLDKLSIEFAALRSRKVNGVMQRVKARLTGVALTNRPAYAGAGVLAVREEDEELEHQIEIVELPRLRDFDQELVRQMEAMGIAVPDSLKIETTEDSSDK